MNSIQDFLDFITGNSFIMLNTKLIHILGLDAAVLLTYLINKSIYFVNKGQTDDGWFFNTVENLRINTGLSHHRQTEAIKKLQHIEIIDKKRKGIPPKQWFKINHNGLKAFVGTIIKNSILIDKDFDINKSNIQGFNYNKIKVNKIKEVSKDTNTNSGELEVLKTSFLNRWNSLKRISPNIRKHSVNTKTHQIINNYCTLLTKGKFFTNRKLDVKWMNDNKIPSSILIKKWELPEIYSTFRKLALSFTEDYPPYDKKGLPKGLPALIYNPRSNKSWFIKLFVNPPVKLSEQINDKHPKFTEMFLPLFDDNLAIQDKKKLVMGVASIIEIHKKLNFDNINIQFKFRQPKALCEIFIDYLNDEVNLKIYPGMISATSKTWNNFVAHQEYIMNLKDYGETLMK